MCISLMEATGTIIERWGRLARVRDENTGAETARFAGILRQSLLAIEHPCVSALLLATAPGKRHKSSALVGIPPGPVECAIPALVFSPLFATNRYITAPTTESTAMYNTKVAPYAMHATSTFAPPAEPRAREPWVSAALANRLLGVFNAQADQACEAARKNNAPNIFACIFAGEGPTGVPAPSVAAAAATAAEGTKRRGRPRSSSGRRASKSAPRRSSHGGGGRKRKRDDHSPTRESKRRTRAGEGVKGGMYVVHNDYDEGGEDDNDTDE